MRLIFGEVAWFWKWKFPTFSIRWFCELFRGHVDNFLVHFIEHKGYFSEKCLWIPNNSIWILIGMQPIQILVSNILSSQHNLCWGTVIIFSKKILLHLDVKEISCIHILICIVYTMTWAIWDLNSNFESRKMHLG